MQIQVDIPKALENFEQTLTANPCDGTLERLQGYAMDLLPHATEAAEKLHLHALIGRVVMLRQPTDSAGLAVLQLRLENGRQGPDIFSALVAIANTATGLRRETACKLLGALVAKLEGERSAS